VQRSEDHGIEQAANELIERFGRQGALSFQREHMERLVRQGDWGDHDAAARVLSALERAAGALPPAAPPSGPEPGTAFPAGPRESLRE
jgi:hypothetical protein